MEGLYTELVGQAVWAIGVVVVSKLYVGFIKDRAKFSGQWLRAEIRWTPEWAAEQLIGRPAQDAHSEGKIALSWDAGRDRRTYWGLSSWSLCSGTERLSQLCVEFHSFDIVRKWRFLLPRHELRSCRLRSEFRCEQNGFEYPSKFASYRVRFDSSSAEELTGKVVVEGNDSGRVVGAFRAVRV
ncbi:MAG TPA: hypothetical protein VKZ48_01135 [Burkholderiales bacterium]|nr:hypothetical protein [Burkholderiales bacterium]